MDFGLLKPPSIANINITHFCASIGVIDVATRWGRQHKAEILTASASQFPQSNSLIIVPT